MYTTLDSQTVSFLYNYGIFFLVASFLGTFTVQIGCLHTYEPGRVAQSVGHLTRSGNILSFVLPLFQEEQLSVTGESMCTKYWLTA